MTHQNSKDNTAVKLVFKMNFVFHFG